MKVVQIRWDEISLQVGFVQQSVEQFFFLDEAVFGSVDGGDDIFDILGRGLQADVCIGFNNEGLHFFSIKMPVFIQIKFLEDSLQVSFHVSRHTGSSILIIKIIQQPKYSLSHYYIYRANSYHITLYNIQLNRQASTTSQAPFYLILLMRKQLHKQKQTITIRTLNQHLVHHRRNNQHEQQQNRHHMESFLDSFTKDHPRRQDEARGSGLRGEDRGSIDSPTKFLNGYLKAKELNPKRSVDYIKHGSKSENSTKMQRKVFDLSLNISKIKYKEDNPEMLRRLKEKMEGIQFTQERQIIDGIKFLKSIEDNYGDYLNQEGGNGEEGLEEEESRYDRSEEIRNGVSRIKQFRNDMQIRFKEKIMYKQSRKHIYRVLKNKSEAREKIRAKTFNHIDHKNQSNQIKALIELQTCKESSPVSKEKTYTHLPYGQLNLKLKTISNIKSNTKPLFQIKKKDYKDLKIQSRTYLQTAINFGSKTKEQNEEMMPMIDQKNYKMNGIEIYKEKVANISPQQKKLRKKLSTNFNTPSNQRGNEFQELTPWGQDEK